MSVEENLRLMKTLDDAWNAGPGSPEWETFRKRHVDNVAVYWPGQPEPTRGRHNHDSEAVEFFKIFPDNHLVNIRIRSYSDKATTLAPWPILQAP